MHAAADHREPVLPIHSAQVRDIDPETWYRIAALRQEVFVVEQNCVYRDLDGRDLERGALQFWAADADGTIAATLRTLPEDANEPGLTSIGRVVTAPAWRDRGVAADLMRAAIERWGDRPAILHAQSHLTGWYARFGFAVAGDEYVEDGIPHTPMRRS